MANTRYLFGFCIHAVKLKDHVCVRKNCILSSMTAVVDVDKLQIPSLDTHSSSLTAVRPLTYVGAIGPPPKVIFIFLVCKWTCRDALSRSLITDHRRQNGVITYALIVDSSSIFYISKNWFDKHQLSYIFYLPICVDLKLQDCLVSFL